MPTPDTEALAARLRAVERALTDEEAVLDPPVDGATDDDTPHDDTELERRVRRLEAGVQALRAALDAGQPRATASPTPATTDAAADADGTRSAATPGTPAGEGAPRSGRPEAGDGWPDDLATGER